MGKCYLCPRMCGADRAKGETGYCKMSEALRVARAALHMWEEPCISGKNGSGAVFFSGCTCRCVFCQNSKIAAGRTGKEITTERLADIFLELQEKNAENINLVTPTHYVLQIVKSLEIAKSKGLSIPVVYNTSGYENVETLKMLDGLVDIYLPDLKYKSSEISYRYSNAQDYFEKASMAINEMVRQVPAAWFDEDDMMKKGVIVRHLVLPGMTKDSKKVIKYLYDTYKNDIYISIMNQYTPLSEQLVKYPEINRKLTKREYDSVVDYAIDIGVVNGFIQEGGTAKESFIPGFDCEGV